MTGPEEDTAGGQELPLGAFVTIAGVVVGQSRFQHGAPTYLVEFDQKGRTRQEWFHAEDLDLDEFEEGAGV